MQRRLPTIISRIDATLSPNAGPYSIFPVSAQCFRRSSTPLMSNDRGTVCWYDIGHRAMKNCNLRMAYSLSTTRINVSNDVGRGDDSGRDNASSKCMSMPETRYVGDDIGYVRHMSACMQSLRSDCSCPATFKPKMASKVTQSPSSTNALGNNARLSPARVLLDSIMVKSTRSRSNATSSRPYVHTPGLTETHVTIWSLRNKATEGADATESGLCVQAIDSNESSYREITIGWSHTDFTNK